VVINSSHVRGCFAWSLLFAVLGVIGANTVRAQTFDYDGFFPQPDQPALAFVEQPDHKILVGGNFSQIGNLTRSRLARLNPDGTVDTDFANVAIDFEVTAIALQSDGRIVIGGQFGFIGTIARNKIARLNADGTLDTTFNPNVTGFLQTILQQPDGKLIITGQFNAVGGQPRNNIARLNADGSLDTAFDPNADGFVYTVALQADGKVLVGGVFTHIGDQPRAYLARLYADGAVDKSYTANPDNFVLALSIQKDGTAFVGGAFTHIGGRARVNLARLHADGSADANFIPDPNNFVFALLLLPDGKLIVGGSFTQMYGQTREGIARFNADGTLDPDFHTTVGTAAALNAGDDGVLALAVQMDGRLLIGGHFTSTDDYILQNFIRMNVDGSVDGAFMITFGSVALVALTVLPDGKFVVSGQFEYESVAAWSDFVRFNGDGQPDSSQTQSPFSPEQNTTLFQGVALPHHELIVGGTNSGMLKLSGNGAIDPSFTEPAIDNGIFAMAPQLDGKIVVGGSLTGGLLRVNTDGSLDVPFFLTANGIVTALAVQADGKIVLAGSFSIIGGQFRTNIARLNADGSLDMAYNPGVTRAINPGSLQLMSLVVQADGKLLVGGRFDTIAGQARNNLARLNEDGTLDASFNPNPDNVVDAIALQLDGKIVIGGLFSTIAPGVTRNRLARINADGSLDEFNAHVDSTTEYTEVRVLAVEADGKMIAMGAFPHTIALGITRFEADQPAVQSLDINASTVKWTRTGAGPELSLPAQLLMSLDGNTYTLLGTMQRTSGGWSYPGFTAPHDQTFYLRTSGRVGGTGLLETTRQFYVRHDEIFTDGFE
jgi:uncharacterized delta-60 repeat protein